MLFNQPKPHWKGFTNWQTFCRHRDSDKRMFKPKTGQFWDHNHCLQPNNSIRLMDHFQREFHHSQLNNLVKRIFRAIDHFQHHCWTQFQIILIVVHMVHQLKVLQLILAHIYRHEATYHHKRMISHFNEWSTLLSFS